MNELEVKVQVGDEFVLPPLGELRGVALPVELEPQRLVADYYDTADLRLARDGVPVPRRSGGDDDGCPWCGWPR